MKLSVVVPCFNEAATIDRLVEAVRAAPWPDIELIVVADGSADGSKQLLEGTLRGRIDVLLLHESNRGKGAALRTGFQASTGELVIVQDADLEYDPRDYPAVLMPLMEARADAVYGSRFLGGAPHRMLYFWHSVGNGLLTALSNLCTNLNLSDMETGCKAFRREIIQSIELEEERFGFEPEVTAKLARRGARIFEVGVSYSGRTYAEGKKIGLLDGLRAVYCVLKYNLRR